jgi:hypothetical protein
MGFSIAQIKALAGKLDRRHVQTRKLDDRAIDYIEGWFAVSEANAIFGFGGWDRETIHVERLFERTRSDVTTCSYMARVKIVVRAGTTKVMREGSGIGSASSKSSGDAYERAIKSAETDATKRALATFGNRFGLGLYDREQAGVTPRGPANGFTLKDQSGHEMAVGISGEAFCSALRQMALHLTDGIQIEQIWQQNAKEIARLRSDVPGLCTNKGTHFADVLERLLAARKTETIDGSGPVTQPDTGLAGSVDQPKREEPIVLVTPAVTVQTPTNMARLPIDKAALPIGVTRRERDKDHIRHVGTLPCLICEQMPSHAHHLTFAQPRGLALKVSDEFVVPLCALHHNELHRSGSEELWWKRTGLEPLYAARTLWEDHLRGHLNRTAQIA